MHRTANGGAISREISAMAPHGGDVDEWSGWIDDVEIDPNNPEYILHGNGGGVCHRGILYSY